MKEQKVLKNEVTEFYIVKVNDLFASGWNLGRNDPIKLNMLEHNASKYEELEKAVEIAEKINGEVFKVIDTQIHTKSYEKLIK